MDDLMLSERTAVLVVEPQPQVRAAVSQVLDTSGYDVIEAECPRDAFAALEERGDLRVVVADIDMADAAEGLAFAHQVHDRWPAKGLVITSGHVRRLHPREVPGDGVFMPRSLPRQAFLEVVSLAAFQAQ
jgi:DNA-binding NtrC family response regulator